MTNPLEEAANGMIIVNSDPTGAKIFLNGFNTGKVTPDSILYLDEGEYEIVLKLDLFLDTLIIVTLSDNNVHSIYIDYLTSPRNFGRIQCYSDPSSALIYLDDSATGLHTPNTLNLIWPGEHEIKFTYPEHRASKQTLSVEGGKTISVSHILQDTSHCVDYNMENSDFISMNTSCIEVDKDNIKWIGTPASGVVKMEGETFTHYNSANSPLLSNIINCITIDDANRKWIGTCDGLVIIDGDNWTLLNCDNSDMPQDFITAICCDKNGGAWIGATDLSIDKYLLYYAGDNWTSIPVTQFIRSIALDNNNIVWVGFDFGVEIWDGIQWSNPLPDSLGNYHDLRRSPVESIEIDKEGNIWFGAGAINSWPLFIPAGLYVFNQLEYRKIELQENLISHCHISDNGNIWISCLGDYYSNSTFGHTIGLIKIDPSGFIINYENLLNSSTSCLISWTATDKNGNVWLATRQDGVIKFKEANL